MDALRIILLNISVVYIITRIITEEEISDKTKAWFYNIAKTNNKTGWFFNFLYEVTTCFFVFRVGFLLLFI